MFFYNFHLLIFNLIHCISKLVHIYNFYFFRWLFNQIIEHVHDFCQCDAFGGHNVIVRNRHCWFQRFGENRQETRSRTVGRQQTKLQDKKKFQCFFGRFLFFYCLWNGCVFFQTNHFFFDNAREHFHQRIIAVANTTSIIRSNHTTPIDNNR